MASQAAKRVLVVAGLGNGSGTGGSTASRLFAKQGYTVALISRASTVGDANSNTPSKLADEINAAGGHAAAFPVPSYSPNAIADAWKAIHQRFPTPEYAIRAAVFNAGDGVWKPFLDITQAEVKKSLETGVEGAFEFARGAITTFKTNDLEEPAGKRGTLIFTGATASIRGNTTTSLFSAGKFALRALSQSLAKEFGKENIHVAHTIIDGGILMDRQRERQSAEWVNNENVRLNPDSIAQSYIYLVNQDRSSWTWELDLRPAHEKW
ncbi:hypothetical protein CVT24_013383 [Panaeolus cyanescens]|uniref:Uncharacterized protein n=1 Tax=Panaeolus cyanescens TaxID=181874 RepID=A0A409YMP6_9AGAR|nr:hypothetical protein CVT24_013383 [Panaeolus cyanescens]